MDIFLFSKDAMVIKIVENGIKSLKLPLKVCDYFNPVSLQEDLLNDTNSLDFLVFFDDSIPNLTHIPKLEFPKVLLYKKNSKPIENFDHYIKKPFLPTQILEIVRLYYKEDAAKITESHNIEKPIIPPVSETKTIMHQNSLDSKIEALDDDIEQSLENILLDITDETDFNGELLFQEPQAVSLSMQDASKSAIADIIPSVDVLTDEEIAKNEAIKKEEELDTFFNSLNTENNPFEEAFQDFNQEEFKAEENTLQDTFDDNLDAQSFDNPDDTMPKNPKLAFEEATSDLSLANPDLAQEDFPIKDNSLESLETLSDSTTPNILNPNEIDEVKRLLEETSITQEEKEDEMEKENESEKIEAKAHNLDAIDEITETLDDLDFMDLDTTSKQVSNSTQEELSTQTPISIHEFLEATKSNLNEIEQLNIDEDEMLHIFESTSPQTDQKSNKDSQLPPNIPSNSIDFINFIKNTPQDELEKMLKGAKISLDIDFKD